MVLITSIFSTSGCTQHTPRPVGQLRIELPEPVYRPESVSGFSFLVSDQAQIEQVMSKDGSDFFDVVYGRLNARLHGSLFCLKQNDLAELSEESRKLVHMHVRRADMLSERRLERPEEGVYGLLYVMKGKVVSPTQWVLTDSVSWFFRGALYFSSLQNSDSIQPVLEHINKDIGVFMESFRWKK